MADDALTLGDLDTSTDDGGPPAEVVESVAETLQSVMDGDTGEDGGDDAEAGSSAAPDDTGDQTTDDRPRDEHGRFVSTREDGADGEEGDRQQAAGDDDGEASEDGEDGEKEEGPLEPPADWSAEQHEIFRALDPAAQKFVLDRVQEADARSAEATTLQSNYDAISQAIAPHKEGWALRGLDEIQGIRSMAEATKFAYEKPAEFIQWFATGRGIDLAELAGVDRSTAAAGAAGDDDDDEFADPEVKALKAELRAATQKIQELEGTFTAKLNEQTSREAEAETARVATEVTNFKTAKNEDGSLAHPYFDQVANFMVTLIRDAQERGEALTLADAYETACRANRDVSAKIEAAEKAKAAKTEATKRREKSTAATRAGSSVSGRPAPAETHTSDSIVDLLTAEAKRVGVLSNPI